MTQVFNSTKERHDYYKKFCIELGQEYRLHFNDEVISRICIFIDSVVTLSKDAPDNESNEPQLQIPSHFIPEGSRCPSCGAEITEDQLVEGLSDSVRSITKCGSCDAVSTFYMSNAIASLLRGKKE